MLMHTEKRLLMRVSDLAAIEASRSEIRESFPRECKEPEISSELLEISREPSGPYGLRCAFRPAIEPLCKFAALAVAFRN